MAGISISWGDIDGLRRFDNMLKALGGPQMQKASAAAINRSGDMAKTQVTRALSKQTGLKRGIIVKAIGKPKRANWGDLSYEMKTEGGDVSLKYFAPKETEAGVRAKPFGKSTIFPATFLSGGEWPGGRTGLIAGGHAFFRAGGSRLPIERARSGVIIPAEMVKGATALAFERSVQQNLPRRLEHELNRITGGALS
ncbi:MAG TPA: hypothetical protein VGN79_12270 [Devosia sp.]|nr:hypothetical protein [Devosia sp.]